MCISGALSMFYAVTYTLVEYMASQAAGVEEITAVEITLNKLIFISGFKDAREIGEIAEWQGG